MSIWTEFNGELVLSGKKYDGKGFGLRSVWHHRLVNYGSSCEHQYAVLKNGKIILHDFDWDAFGKELRKSNVPHGREGGSIIDILVSKVYGDTHVTFFKSLRDADIRDCEIRDWILNFIKTRQKEGWTVVGTINYGTFDLDHVTIIGSHQECALEYRHAYRCIEGKVELWEETYKHYLNEDHKPELIQERYIESNKS